MGIDEPQSKHSIRSSILIPGGFGYADCRRFIYGFLNIAQDGLKERRTVADLLVEDSIVPKHLYERRQLCQ